MQSGVKRMLMGRLVESDVTWVLIGGEWYHAEASWVEMCGLMYTSYADGKHSNRNDNSTSYQGVSEK